MKIDLIGSAEGCQKGCEELFFIWENWIKSNRPFGEVLISEEIISHKYLPAVIIISKTYEAYLKQIGCKSRNMIVKSQKNNYEAREISYNLFLEDIFEINNSKEFRQGKRMSAKYQKYPEEARTLNCCDVHKIKYFGVLKEDKLVAWCNVNFMNEFAIINQILGHAEHLKFGIMNLLINFIIKDCIENYKQVKCLNYLTLKACLPGLRTFKKSVGFEEVKIEFLNNFKR
jgi:hypothetical protein